MIGELVPMCIIKLKEGIEIARKDIQHNIEQLSAKLLFELTRNTGVEISKSRLGLCWLLSCCEWNERQENDV